MQNCKNLGVGGRRGSLIPDRLGRTLFKVAEPQSIAAESLGNNCEEPIPCLASWLRHKMIIIMPFAFHVLLLCCCYCCLVVSLFIHFLCFLCFIVLFGLFVVFFFFFFFFWGGGGCSFFPFPFFRVGGGGGNGGFCFVLLCVWWSLHIIVSLTIVVPMSF